MALSKRRLLPAIARDIQCASVARREGVMVDTSYFWQQLMKCASRKNCSSAIDQCRRVGRVCPQAGGAGTKAERGHSCPQQRRTEVKLSNATILLSIRELLRTRMSALRWRPQNLRDLRRLLHILIQRAGVQSGSCDGALRTGAPCPPSVADCGANAFC